MKKLLLVVDPQIDFINDSLPIGGAPEAMDELAKYIAAHNGEYAYKIVTADWHPYCHCSFKDNGGVWPLHCVAHTTGAALWPALVNPLYTTAGPVKVLHKGVYADREEYSIFQNLKSAAFIADIVQLMGIEQIDVCGLAGDVCVLETLKDGIARYGKQKFRVLREFSPSLDGGKALDALLQEMG